MTADLRETAAREAAARRCFLVKRRNARRVVDFAAVGLLAANALWWSVVAVAFPTAGGLVVGTGLTTLTALMALIPLMGYGYLRAAFLEPEE